MPTKEPLDTAAVARRAGVKPPTINTYLSRARKKRAEGVNDPADLPEPAATYGARPVWSEKSIDRWLLHRRPPGRRAAAKGNQP